MAVRSTRLALLATLTIALSLTTGGTGAAPVTLAAELAPSTTSLGAPDLDPKPVGHTSTLSAMVTPGATGDVTFYDNGMPVVTIPLTGSTATYTMAAYSRPGAHTITAGYRGDATFAASTSQPRQVTVGPRPVTLTIGVRAPETQPARRPSRAMTSGSWSESGTQAHPAGRPSRGPSRSGPTV